MFDIPFIIIQASLRKKNIIVLSLIKQVNLQSSLLNKIIIVGNRVQLLCEAPSTIACWLLLSAAARIHLLACCKQAERLYFVPHGF